MKVKPVCKHYSRSFKEESVALILEQGSSVQKTVDTLGIRSNMLYHWQ
ncbi:Transposase [Nitrosomonas aestuarii]|uniref:Transposase n=1 Tax=Nitrosomonas aestuarii TaxID=52441 RepID=A0A1I4FZ72_9PROT|nr:transposase [Nitrosomonas aestuarii]SFL22773.1 Transposase [Nitrosomonas aestuarii]